MVLSHRVSSLPWQEDYETLPELCVTFLAPLAWLVYGQLSVLAGSAWHSVPLLCRLSEGRENRTRFYLHAQRYGREGWPFSLPKSRKGDVLSLPWLCQNSSFCRQRCSQCSEQQFQGEIRSEGAYKPTAKLWFYTMSHPCLPLLYETSPQRSNQFLYFSIDLAKWI